MIVLMVLKFAWVATGLNLSPEANYVFKHPTLKTFIRPQRSSFFGFSVNLRTSSVIVGAPRAQSDSEYQRNINETGAIYKCSFANQPVCAPFRLDRQGNSDYEDPYQNLTEIRSQIKEHQMLGATVAGLGADDGWFVACAPRLKGWNGADARVFLHGICYLTEGVAAIDEPSHLYSIKPLRLKAEQRNYEGNFNYMYGELGFSLHVTDDGDQVLIGAPGVMTWRGTVVRYRRPKLGDTWNGSNVYVEADKARGLRHECVVPNPVKTNLTVYSYFGYAVSSARFLGTQGKLLYVASAPQAREQKGEVIIFDYINNKTAKEIQMKRHWTFVGEQFGEYFGYALMTEDFNSDGWPDLAIGAPFRSRTNDSDHGVVYVWLNFGQMNFELQIKLASTYELGGRFGTSLGKIGDVNRDGYGDIAIGAPFEGDGAVYIFHGSANGVKPSPSQRLVPFPAQSIVPPKQPHMFGHALSRGVDIDGNGFNDLAVGAPNGEAVYVFRAYPTVWIEARINSTKHVLPADGGSLDIALCWSTEYPGRIPFPVALQYTLDVDGQMGRATVMSNRTTPETGYEYVTVGVETLCLEHIVVVTASPATLYKPILIELKFDIAAWATPPKAGAHFCTHCAVLDPPHANRVQERILFKTGCQNDTCVADLKILSVRWTDIPAPFVVGSFKRGTFEVEIENAGENAYHPQLNFTVPAFLRAVDSTASKRNRSEPVDGRVGILCEVNGGLPLQNSAQIKHTLVFDLTQVWDVSAGITIHVQALSNGAEKSPEDNEREHVMDLAEFSHIEIVSKPSPREANLVSEAAPSLQNVTQLIKLHNIGPSALNGSLLHVDVPLTYTPAQPSTGGRKSCRIIRLSDINARSSYNDTPLEVKWIEPIAEHDFLQQPFDFHSPEQPNSLTPAGDTHDGGIVPSSSTVEQSDTSQKDPVDYDYFRLPQPFESRLARQKRSNLGLQPAVVPPLSSPQTDDLPPTRTVLFNCAQNHSTVECLQLLIPLPYFATGSAPVVVELQYRLDLAAIEACLEERQDIFEVKILSDVQKPTDERRETFRTAHKHLRTVVVRDASVSTPISIYVGSSFGGLLLLAVICYMMQRLGFFKRHMKQEMEKLHRESLAFEDDSNDMTNEEQHVSEV
uniref:Integrin alpha second immunoglobulin-like domain-containing protein n=1 Tax=Anopheles dirus TaxID=7168 RepID=A0A182N9J2_9DIPT